MSSSRVIGLGLATVDIVFLLEEMPRWDHAPGFSDFTVQGGGMTGTAMVAASRLGLSAGYVGTVGSDEMGEIKSRSLSREGVDVTGLKRRTGRERQIILVYVNEKSGERRFSSLKGMGGELLRVDELDRGYFQSADLLLIDGFHHDAAAAAARWMREAGKRVVLDAGMPRKSLSPAVERLLERTDAVIAGSGFARAATGITDIEEAARRVLDRGPQIFVQTEGSDGSFTATKDGFFRTPAFNVEVVDTTGAGDTFHGAYLVGLSRGWSLKDTALFASAAAAMKCRKLGGRAGIPNRSDVFAFLEERGYSIGE